MSSLLPIIDRSNLGRVCTIIHVHSYTIIHVYFQSVRDLTDQN